MSNDTTTAIKPNKEQVYDEQIFPLMNQIIAICQGAGIALLADFEICTEEKPTLCCTSVLPDETGDNSPRHQQARRMLISQERTLAIIRISGNQASPVH